MWRSLYADAYSFILITYTYAVFVILNKTCKVKKAIRLKSQESEQVITEVLIQLTGQRGYDIVLNYTHTLFPSQPPASFSTQDIQSSESTLL